MNKVNILKVADTIERHMKSGKPFKGVGFNMMDLCGDGRPDHIDDCKTTACIAGWACLVSGKAKSARGLKRIAYIDEAAAKFFGLPSFEANVLFFPRDVWCLNVLDKTPRQAVATLRHLARTGKVNWRARYTENQR